MGVAEWAFSFSDVVTKAGSDKMKTNFSHGLTVIGLGGGVF